MDAKSQSIVAFLQSCGEAAPSLAPNYARMEELYKRKLWHQLTVLLEEHLGEEAAAAQLGGLYETFVSDFKHKLNKLALARIQVAVALNKCADADEVSAFAEAALADHAGELESGAFVLCELSRMLLRFGKQEAAKEKLDAAAAKIEGAAGVTPEVQAPPHRRRRRRLPTSFAAFLPRPTPLPAAPLPAAEHPPRRRRLASPPPPPPSAAVSLSSSLIPATATPSLPQPPRPPRRFPAAALPRPAPPRPPRPRAGGLLPRTRRLLQGACVCAHTHTGLSPPAGPQTFHPQTTCPLARVVCALHLLCWEAGVCMMPWSA